MPPPASFNWIPFCALCAPALQSALPDSCLDTPLFVLWKTGHNMHSVGVKDSRVGQILKEPLTAAWHEAGVTLVCRSNCAGVGFSGRQMPESYLLGWWRGGFIPSPQPFGPRFCSGPHPRTRSGFQVSGCCRNMKGNAHFLTAAEKSFFDVPGQTFPKWRASAACPTSWTHWRIRTIVASGKERTQTPLSLGCCHDSTGVQASNASFCKIFSCNIILQNWAETVGQNFVS